jgi:hypothetical protein
MQAFLHLACAPAAFSQHLPFPSPFSLTEKVVNPFCPAFFKRAPNYCAVFHYEFQGRLDMQAANQKNHCNQARVEVKQACFVQVIKVYYGICRER